MKYPLFGAPDPLRPIAIAVNQIKISFAKAVMSNVGSTLPQSMRMMQGALEYHGAMVIGEGHGLYSHARFVRDFMPYAQETGADRLYVEMLYDRHQDDIDAWQDEGRADQLIWLINKRPAYSEKMWSHYWDVLQAARDNGLRVVAIEPSNKPEFYPGTNIWARNMMWQNAIEKDQHSKDQRRPYIVYCGSDHLWPYACGHTRPLHIMLNAAGVSFAEGSPCLVPPMRAYSPAHMHLPMAEDQTPLTHLRFHRAGMIAYKPC